MKFRLVNDNKLQIIISKEDLLQRELPRWDLALNSPETQQLFHEILEEAREACGFDVGNNTQLMIEAYPMTGESFLLTVTKIENRKANSSFNLDIEALMNDIAQDEETLSEMDMEEIIYRFVSLEDVILGAKRISSLYDGESQLIHYKEAYYLILLNREWIDENILVTLQEYGSEILISMAFFQEHGNIVMEKHAIEILTAL